MAKEPIHQNLLEEWHPTKNIDLNPAKLSTGSSKVVWWLGKCGHEWEASISKRELRGYSCPYCSNKSILVGFNDLATTHPKIAKEWHPTRNGEFAPTKVTAGSSKVVWWMGKCGHEWDVKIFRRALRNSGCPFCSNKKVLKGFNDLATTIPQLAAEWHPTKNTVSPTDILSGSNKLVWWLGLCGHEWETRVFWRGKGNSGCPYCTNQKVLLGFNDLMTTHPDLAKEWHPSKNGDLSPEKITAGSKKSIWWLGECGHEWQAVLHDRTRKQQLHPRYAGDGTIIYGTTCIQCYAKIYVSMAEKNIASYIRSLGLEAEQSNRSLLGKRRELDIYVPEKKVAIEFNGLYWHSESAGKDKTYHHDKWKACKDEGIQLIQIWEDEWKRNPEQVKQMLAHKLGVSTQEKVFARKTVVAEVSKLEAEQFLHANHIQGYASGSYYLGLKRKENDELVSLIVLKKEAGTNGKTLNIIRYATAANVVGGFTKLLTHAEKLYKPESFITFADHCVSDGGLYENNGFTVDRELAPDYMYIVGGERKHKFGYRLKRFQSDPELEYVDGLTERELAALNGLERVWDAGKTRYRKTM